MSDGFRRPEKAPTLSAVLKEARHAPSSGAAGETALATPAAGSTSQPRQILRFRKSERQLHWSIAVPFMVCYATGLTLMVFYNLRSESPSREFISLFHRVAGACLIVFPLLAMVRHWRDYKIHVGNIKQAWTWVMDDVKWLTLMGAAAVSSRVSLPEQGKFNAAEKLNFMMVMCTYPLFILTGLLLWMPGIKFVSWIVHVGMALVATPLMLGHIYMATINRSTRVGLSGMLSGYVDRYWAKHHYRRWYRQNFEAEESALRKREEPPQPLWRPALIRCASCSTEHRVASWARLLETIFDVRPLRCPSCGKDADTITVIVEPEEVDSILRCLEQAGFGRSVERVVEVGLPRSSGTA